MSVRNGYLAVAVLVMLVLIAGTDRGPGIYAVFGVPYYSLGLVEGFAQLVALLAFGIALARERKRSGWAYLGAVCRTTLVVVLVWEMIWNLDILYITAKANYLCRNEAKVRVYRSVRAPGMAGLIDTRYWTDYGFSYIENGAVLGRDKAVAERSYLENGAVVVKRASKFESPVALKQTTNRPHSYGLTVSIDRIVEMSSSDVLGERTAFGILPGFFERVLMSFIPGARSPWRCRARRGPTPRFPDGAPVSLTEFIKMTVKPPVQGVYPHDNKGVL